MQSRLKIKNIDDQNFPDRRCQGSCFSAPSMGDSYRVKVPNGGWLYQPLAQGKGVDREVESEGSRRQNPDLRYTNPI